MEKHGKTMKTWKNNEKHGKPMKNMEKHGKKHVSPLVSAVVFQGFQLGFEIGKS